MAGRRAEGRYELKYVVPEECARAIAEHVRPYCDPDPFLEGEREYTISSLYLDTPTLAHYHQKRIHQRDRVKVRIRTYGMLSDGPVFLELKRRTGDVVVKSRARVPRERWVALASSPGPVEMPDLRALKQYVVEDFRTHVLGLAMRPVVVVRYDREPYVGRTDPGVRVTFDRRLRFLPASEFVLPSRDVDYLPFDYAGVFFAGRSLVVLEIKFDERFPVWVPDLIRRFDLARVSFSKYCNSLERVLSCGWDHHPGRLAPVMV